MTTLPAFIPFSQPNEEDLSLLFLRSEILSSEGRPSVLSRTLQDSLERWKEVLQALHQELENEGRGRKIRGPQENDSQLVLKFCPSDSHFELAIEIFLNDRSKVEFRCPRHFSNDQGKTLIREMLMTTRARDRGGLIFPPPDPTKPERDYLNLILVQILFQEQGIATFAKSEFS